MTESYNSTESFIIPKKLFKIGSLQIQVNLVFFIVMFLSITISGISLINTDFSSEMVRSIRIIRKNLPFQSNRVEKEKLCSDLIKNKKVHNASIFIVVFITCIIGLSIIFLKFDQGYEYSKKHFNIIESDNWKENGWSYFHCVTNLIGLPGIFTVGDIINLLGMHFVKFSARGNFGSNEASSDNFGSDTFLDNEDPDL